MAIENSFVADIRGIITQAQNKAYAAVNFAMVETYWLVGRRIVEEEQRGAERAGYGDFLIRELSKRLTIEIGEGFSIVNLKSFRKFYIVFNDNQKGHALRTLLQHTDNHEVQKGYAARALFEQEIKLPVILRKELSWTHYRLIMRVENPLALQYYIKEAADHNWSTRTLERNINTFYYERILSSRNKNESLQEAGRFEKQSPADFIKDPYIFEFLNIPEPRTISEHNFETALVDNLQHFLLELGKGFSFVKRQYRVNTETKSFSIDLVFYNYILKCFVLFDLKTGELAHQDVGQMDMYVRMFNDMQRDENDNPTIGIILCTSKDETIVKYSVLNENEQLFATKYRLYLPTEEELIKEIEREKSIIENKLKNQQ